MYPLKYNLSDVAKVFWIHFHATSVNSCSPWWPERPLVIFSSWLSLRSTKLPVMMSSLMYFSQMMLRGSLLAVGAISAGKDIGLWSE